MRFFFTLIFIFSFTLVNAQDGLKFISNNQPKENRSQLIFEDKFNAKDSLVINFKFSIYNKLFIGDLLNIRNIKNNSTISLSYNFTYSEDNKPFINLNIKGIKNLVKIQIPENFIQYQKWIDVKLKIDYKLNQAELKFLNNTYSISSLFEKNSSLEEIEILFGKNEFNEDIPAFNLKNLELKIDSSIVYFPFDEKQGTRVISSNGNFKGKIINPSWLIDDFNNWKLIKQVEFESNHTIAYDTENMQFILLGKDKRYNFDIVSRLLDKITLKKPSEFHSYTSGKAFIEPKTKNILVLQTGEPNPSQNKFLNKKLGIESINNTKQSNNKNTYSIASFNSSTSNWQGLFYKDILKNPLFHFNAYYENSSQNILIFGGYSDFKYLNRFLKYDSYSNSINEILIEGDNISPRFKSGMGSLNDSILFLYGGEGNLSGDQSIGKIPFNDLYKIDLKNNSINLVWEKEYDSAHNSISKNLIFDETQEFFYCLADSEEKGAISLKKVSVNDGNRVSLGRSINFDSSIIANEFNLFYEKKNNKLYAYTVEFTDNKLEKNIISFYSIEMEPFSANSTMNEKVELSQSFMNSKWIIVGLIIILFIILIVIFNRKPIISLKSESKKDYIFVRSDRSDVKLFFDKVIALEAMKDYTKIVVKENSYMVHGNISSFIKKFPKDKFVRIHRSTVINVDFITSFEGSTVNLERNHYTIGGKYMSDIKKYLN
jgi:hypothetical protein